MIDRVRLAVEGGPWWPELSARYPLLDLLLYPDRIPDAMGIRQPVPLSRLVPATCFRCRFEHRLKPGRGSAAASSLRAGREFILAGADGPEGLVNRVDRIDPGQFECQLGPTREEDVASLFDGEIAFHEAAELGREELRDWGGCILTHADWFALDRKGRRFYAYALLEEFPKADRLSPWIGGHAVLNKGGEVFAINIINKRFLIRLLRKHARLGSRRRQAKRRG